MNKWKKSVRIFFCRSNFTPFMSKSFQIWYHFFSLLFPKDSKKQKKFAHWTSESEKHQYQKKIQLKGKIPPKTNLFRTVILHPLLVKVVQSDPISFHYFSESGGKSPAYGRHQICWPLKRTKTEKPIKSAKTAKTAKKC